jgi:hypothetical protein
MYVHPRAYFGEYGTESLSMFFVREGTMDVQVSRVLWPIDSDARASVPGALAH